jgi:hypothetical protein
MLPYWLLFLIPAIAAITDQANMTRQRALGFGWIMMWLLLTLMIGWRYQVGADWFNYERIFRSNLYFSFSEVLRRDDPAYGLLNWWAAKNEFTTTFVNTICGAIFAWGLITFARRQPLPWLAILVAVPYLVTVVAMGYTRQAVAIGCALLALSGLAQNSTVRFAIWIGVAALFHKTAVLLIPVAVLATTKSRIWTGVWVGAFALLLYQLLLAESVDRLISGYIDAGYQSQGAAIRVAMNALPAAAFMLYREHFQLKGAELNLWTYMSLGALGFIILLLVSPSSTAVDRMALYLVPVQIFVLSRLPLALERCYGAGQLAQIGVVTYSALVLFVWLNFAAHSRYWLPYQMVPFAS